MRFPKGMKVTEIGPGSTQWTLDRKGVLKQTGGTPARTHIVGDAVKRDNNSPVTGDEPILDEENEVEW